MPKTPTTTITHAKMIRSASAFLIVVFCAVVSHAKQKPEPALHADFMPIVPAGDRCGKNFPGKSLGIGPTMDVAVADDFIYAIGKGNLVVLPADRPGGDAVVGRVSALGNTRQIAVSRGHAYVTSREDGVFVVDVRNPATPHVVGRYDSAELATAVAVSGDVAAVGNRFAGVELLDVSTPAEPRHLSTIRVGEVQSLVFHGSWLYAGTWSEKAVTVIDVANPWRPRLAATVPLDGNGDGLDVRGTLLAAATGHHARAKGSPKPGDAAFGHGHGVEFFDVSNPEQPRRLSGLKFPPFYRLGMDVWGVKLVGDHAFVNDTYNGFFLVDIRDPTKPACVGWRQLPTPKWSKDPSPATGVDVFGSSALVAGAHDDLHIVQTGLPVKADLPAAGLTVPPAPDITVDTGTPRYDAGGPVRAVAPWRDGLLLVAAGSGGLNVVRMTPDGFEGVARYNTRGFARDVAFHGDWVYVAESLGGLSMWRVQTDGKLERLGSHEVTGNSIHQVVLADDGRIAFLAVGAAKLQIVRPRGDGTVEVMSNQQSPTGLFYREPFAPLTADGRRLLAQWHVSGLHEFVVADGTAKPSGWVFSYPMDTECGATPWGDGWLATSRQGFFTLRPGEKRSPTEIGLVKPGGRSLPGKPSVSGTALFIADPFLGDVTAIDLADEKNPRVVGAIHLDGHPGRIRVHEGKALIPAGRDGLLRWNVAEKPANKP